MSALIAKLCDFAWFYGFERANGAGRLQAFRRALGAVRSMNYGPLGLPANETFIRREAHVLIAVAARLGFHVEIERQPMPPLSMGNHAAVVRVWSIRQADGTYPPSTGA